MKAIAVILAVAGVLSGPLAAAASCRCAGCSGREEGVRTHSCQGAPRAMPTDAAGAETTAAPSPRPAGCCGHESQPPRQGEPRKTCACLHAAQADAALPAPQDTPDSRRQGPADLLGPAALDAGPAVAPTWCRHGGYFVPKRPPPQQPSLRATVLLL